MKYILLLLMLLTFGCEPARPSFNHPFKVYDKVTFIQHEDSCAIVFNLRMEGYIEVGFFDTNNRFTTTVEPAYLFEKTTKPNKNIDRVLQNLIKAEKE